MHKGFKIGLSFFTMLPFAYILCIIFVFNDFRYNVIQVLHYTMMAIYVVLLVIYTRDVRNNDRLPNEKRALWGTLIFIGSSLAQFIYL